MPTRSPVAQPVGNAVHIGGERIIGPAFILIDQKLRRAIALDFAARLDQTAQGFRDILECFIGDATDITFGYFERRVR